MGKFNFDGYARLLAKWVQFSQKHLDICPDCEGFLCYGPATGTNWGMQTHLKAMSAFAVVAKLENIDLSEISVSREEIKKQSLSMLRYALRTHLTGDSVCSDGQMWGHSWIFALGIERMFHAIELLWDDLTDDDKRRLRELMISESDFILNEYPIVAGLVEGNKPESNIWNGALLYRTAALYPDAQNRDAYLEKAYRFFANGISIESDENSDEIVAGRRIGDVFVGANMFDSFSCNHHKYLNVGYMNICLSNIAMLHFFLKSTNTEPNPIIYHNLYEQWRLIRSTTFSDGRLLRIGGDTRARYCYCQDYALVGWQLIEDVFGEDCTELENEWLKILEKETSVNGDGSFLSARFGYFEDTSPIYYTRLESDRANAISLSLYWHHKYGLDVEGSTETLKSWRDEYHGAAFVSSDDRFASFAWRAAEAPSALFVPSDESSLAEWRGNLTAAVYGLGNKNEDDVNENRVELFEGGFLSIGSSDAFCDDFGEGQKKETMAHKNIAFAALPDGKRALCIHYIKATNRVYIKECGGIHWNIPNDIFNSRQRCFEFGDKKIYLRGGEYATKEDPRMLGNTLTVDGKIGIASSEPLCLVRRGKRQIDIRGRRDSGTLYCEEIFANYRSERFRSNRGDILSDVGFAMSIGNRAETEEMAASLKKYAFGEMRCVSVAAKDGREYLLAANFSDKEMALTASDVSAKTLVGVSCDVCGDSVSLASGEAILLRIEKNVAK